MYKHFDKKDAGFRWLRLIDDDTTMSLKCGQIFRIWIVETK